MNDDNEILKEHIELINEELASEEITCGTETEKYKSLCAELVFAKAELAQTEVECEPVVDDETVEDLL